MLVFQFPERHKKKNKKMNAIRSDSTPGMRLLALYWLLLFNGRTYSLTDLASQLKCSKQTILRMMDQLGTSDFAYIESWRDDKNGKRWYKLNAPKRRPSVSLSKEDIETLIICRDMVWHLLPDFMRDRAHKAVGHASVLMPNFDDRCQVQTNQAKGMAKGRVDYSKQNEIMATLLKAIENQAICEIIYQSLANTEPRLHRIVPSRLVAHRDTLYIKGWRIPDSGEPQKTTLAVQRIQEVVITPECRNDLPAREQDGYFGIFDGEPFRVKIAVSSKAAPYVRERIWSNDQTIEHNEDGSLILEFSATNQSEVISFVLSFGKEVIVLKPKNLVDHLNAEIVAICSQYIHL